LKKTLVLFTTKNAYYFDHLNIKNVDISGVFSTSTGCDNNFLKLVRKIKSPLTKKFYTEWYEEIKKYERIVVFDTAIQIDPKLLHNIAKINPDADKFVYSWNIVKDEDYYKYIRKQADTTGFAFYCYDRGDCEKYQMKFNTIMYDKALKLEPQITDSDALFLGYLKDRKDKMITLYMALSKVGLIPKFVVVGCEDQSFRGFDYSNQYISYFNYLDMLNKSKSILDIAQDNQDGFSMRVMEAIFYNKKLLTTNHAIRDADFYDPNNILIVDLEQTQTSDYKDFFDKPFHNYSDKMREFYSFESWLERFV